MFIDIIEKSVIANVISFTGNNRIEFIYDATGAKLRKTTYANNVLQETRDYVNGVEYKGGVVDRIAHTEGAVVNQAGTFLHEYTIKDHLGNARVTYSDANNDGVITVSDMKQINHYYPFGMNMEGNWNGAAGTNKYQYNGKELNSDFGLEWNDYGARFYDASIGRFPMVDPLAEMRSNVTPYNYVQNNPVNRIDPTGMIDESRGADGMTNSPFGMNMEGNWNGSFPDAKNKYQYNGKELNSDFGLEWNDYGARFYDATVVRWWAVDPLAEIYVAHTPYNYVMGNPVSLIDPNGMGVSDPNKQSATYINNQFNALQGDYFADKYNRGRNLSAGAPSANVSSGFSSLNASNNDECECDCPNPPCDEDESYIRQKFAISASFGGFNRAYYEYKLGLLKWNYTMANGTLDYEGGSAARTAAKEWFRSRFTSYPVAKFLDWKFPAINPYPNNPTPSFWKDNKLVSGTFKGLSVLGVLGISYEAFGVWNNYSNVSPIGYKTSIGRFSWNATQIGFTTYGGFPGFAAAGTMQTATLYHDRPKTAWDMLRLSFMPFFKFF